MRNIFGFPIGNPNFAGTAAGNAVHRRLISICLCAALLCTTACHTSPQQERIPSIVGTWIVSIPDAPFPIHMFVFHSDGTVVQSNPDAGDPNSSDSNLMGVWVPDGDAFKGRLVEITAHRSTHEFVSRGDITYRITVSGDALHGNATAVFHDADWHQIGIPIQATLDGKRVLP